MNVTLQELFSSVSAPLFLISGIGILVLTINARYTQSISRVREIFSYIQKEPQNSYLKDELPVLVRRCLILKWSFASLVLSTVSSSFLVILSVLHLLINITAPHLAMTLITISCSCIAISMVLLFIDILYSMQALKIHINQ